MIGPVRRAFWRLDGAYPSRSAAERRARAVRWHPLIIERGLVVAVTAGPGGTFRVMIGANSAALLHTP